LSAKPSEVNTADKSAGLQYDLKQEESMLADEQASEKKLEKQLKQLEFDTEGRIKADGIPLKTNPYNHAATILPLKKGQVVTVLSTSKFWYRVRTESGEEGWMYYLFLEPVS
jgi:SH3-like domain-containing protein